MVASCMVTCYNNDSNFLWWLISFIQRQRRQGNLGMSIEVLRQAIGLSPRPYSKYQMFMDTRNLASVAYIEKYLGSKASAVVMLRRLEIQNECKYVVTSFTHQEAIIQLSNNIIAALTAMRAARAINMLQLMSLTELSVGMEFEFMGERCSRNLWGPKARSHRAITGITKHCLQRGIEIESVWDTWQDRGEPLWSVLEHRNLHDSQLFLRAVFTKLKLVFEYLLTCTPAALEAISKQHPDVDLILRTTTGKLPISRDQKIAIACKWESCLILDILEIDVSSIEFVGIANKLIVPKQLNDQPLCIEI